MKWGVRRYQHEDGTRTALGKKHEATLGGGNSKAAKKAIRTEYRSDVKAAKKARNQRFKKMSSEYDEALAKTEGLYKRGATLSKKDQEELSKAGDKYNREYDASNKQYKSDRAAAKDNYKKAMSDLKNSPEYKAEKNAQRKKMMIGAAIVGGTALAAYAGYKHSKNKYNRLMAESSREDTRYKNIRKNSDNAYKLGTEFEVAAKNNRAKANQLISENGGRMTAQARDRMHYARIAEKNMSSQYDLMDRYDRMARESRKYRDDTAARANKTMYARIKNRKKKRR